MRPGRQAKAEGTQRAGQMGFKNKQMDTNGSNAKMCVKFSLSKYEVLAVRAGQIKGIFQSKSPLQYEICCRPSTVAREHTAETKRDF